MSQQIETLHLAKNRIRALGEVFQNEIGNLLPHRVAVAARGALQCSASGREFSLALGTNVERNIRCRIVCVGHDDFQRERIYAPGGVMTSTMHPIPANE